MTISDLPQLIRDHYEVHELNHAIAILKNDFPDQYDDITSILSNFRLLKSHILEPGGRKSPVAAALDGEFSKRGWFEKKIRNQNSD
jgi:hypothetical protein